MKAATTRITCKDPIDRAFLPVEPLQASVGRDPEILVSDIRVSLVDPGREPLWDCLVLSHPDATFFHSAAWAKVLSRTYGHKPVYLRCSQGGCLVALIPMMEVRSAITGCRGVGLPFTDFCAPLIFEQGGADSAIKVLRKWLRSENGSISKFVTADYWIVLLRRL